MLTFSKALKIYLFKHRQQISLSIRVSKSTVNTFRLNQQHFEQLLDNWQQGIELNTEHNHWLIQHKTICPRPERATTSYVRITVSTNNIEYNYRVTYADMLELEKDYYYQKHNTMYWD